MSDELTLRDVLDRYATPPAGLVLKIPGKGFQPEYVGHADATRTLIEIDPEWAWEPQAWDPNGGPLVIERNGQLALWGFLTLLGKKVPCVGTCPADKKEADKELIGDLIRNGAMRFGIFINLWSKADHDEVAKAPEPEDYYGWASKAAHDAWWKPLADTLRGLSDDVRAKAVGELQSAGIFDQDRKPKGPIHISGYGVVEEIIKRAQAAESVADALSKFRSTEAVELLREVLNIDDPLNPPADAVVEDWMWDLAEVADLDTFDWRETNRAINWRMPTLIARAREVARNLAVEEPNGVDGITGILAVELRKSIISKPTQW